MASDQSVMEAVAALAGGGRAGPSVVLGRATSDSSGGNVDVYLGGYDSDGGAVPLLGVDGRAVPAYDATGAEAGGYAPNSATLKTVGTVAAGDVPVIAVTSGRNPTVIGGVGGGDSVAAHAGVSAIGIGEIDSICTI